ncbi:MAG: hypothetical protein JNN31_05620 [Dechloromonas sp.]|nr:hypothetical protein [Dechloromonas sp.]
MARRDAVSFQDGSGSAPETGAAKAIAATALSKAAAILPDIFFMETPYFNAKRGAVNHDGAPLSINLFA